MDVLFVCVHNSGRSQMAEAWFNHLASRRRIDLAATSAGTEPSKAVQPLVVSAMAERGLDISLNIPRVLTDEMIDGSQAVITMGCAVDSSACPSFKYEEANDWQLSDPSVMSLAEVRALRDVIYDNVDRLLTFLTRPVDLRSDT